MKILVLASDYPATANMAGSPRLFSLCRVLAERHRLTLFTFNETAGREAEFRADPTSAGVFEEVVIQARGEERQSWWGTQQHRLRQEPYFVTRYRQPHFHETASRRLREVYQAGGFEALYVDGLQNAQYVADSGLQVPAVMDLHDCVTMLYARKVPLTENFVPRLKARAATAGIRRWEKGLSRCFGAILINSPVDEGYLRSLNPAANVLTIGNGVDSEFFQPQGSETPDFHRLVFTGVMSYAPNEDATLYFCESIFPLIRTRFGDARFDIVGKRPSAQVEALGRMPGVHVAGEVPDVRPYLERAGIFVCPLRWGAGIKNKLLAALAMGKACVATPQSIEGLTLREDVDLLLAREPQEFADKVVQLMGDPARAARLAAAGRDYVVAQYSWDASGRQLEGVLEQLVHRSPARDSAATAVTSH
jgi:sugar transferase (PEP-CTERM/EpsH1 system associated)